VQAGAAKVYAVEASGMAKYAQMLASSNAVGKAIQVGQPASVDAGHRSRDDPRQPMS
jgi:hypothetical protein